MIMVSESHMIIHQKEIGAKKEASIKHDHFAIVEIHSINKAYNFQIIVHAIV